MGTITQIKRSKFSVGDLIHHRLFDYRGVIIDIDPTFQSSEEWYEAVARSRPPKDKRWYHVLEHGATHATYIAEKNLERDESTEPITHPMLAQFVSRIEKGRYVSGNRDN